MKLGIITKDTDVRAAIRAKLPPLAQWIELACDGDMRVAALPALAAITRRPS